MTQPAKHLHAWTAGFFEGEGWCNVSKRQLKNGLRYQLYCGITNTELVLPEKFMHLYGGRIRTCKGTALSRKPLWRREIYDRSAQAFLEAIEPFLFGKKTISFPECDEQAQRDAIIVDMRKHSKGAKNA